MRRASASALGGTARRLMRRVGAWLVPLVTLAVCIAGRWRVINAFADADSLGRVLIGVGAWCTLSVVLGLAMGRVIAFGERGAIQQQRTWRPRLHRPNRIVA